MGLGPRLLTGLGARSGSRHGAEESDAGWASATKAELIDAQLLSWIALVTRSSGRCDFGCQAVVVAGVAVEFDPSLPSSTIAGLLQIGSSQMQSMLRARSCFVLFERDRR